MFEHVKSQETFTETFLIYFSFAYSPFVCFRLENLEFANRENLTNVFTKRNELFVGTCASLKDSSSVQSMDDSLHIGNIFGNQHILSFATNFLS